MITKRVREAIVALDKVQELIMSDQIASFSISMARPDGVMFVLVCDLKTELPEESEDAVREEEAPVQEGV